MEERSHEPTYGNNTKRCRDKRRGLCRDKKGKMMEVTRAYKYRIYPDAKRQREIDERLWLEDRVYHCNVCGLTIDRDINASINILHRATTLGQRGSYAQGESVRPQQEAVLKELRTDKIHPLQDAVVA
ncbi:MAG: zinc ribbon domain-containing protein [Candidatus Micrarchaeia archaeon]